MEYTIKQVSQMTGIPATTLRYYDKEGLLPFLVRKESGYRVFKETDITMLQIIECLKDSGMPIQDIKRFSKLTMQGDDSLEERLQFFIERKKVVEQQMAELQKTLDVVNHKVEYYQKAIELGSEKPLLTTDKLPHADEFACRKA